MWWTARGCASLASGVVSREHGYPWWPDESLLCAVYELYSSLLEADADYTYDIATAHPHCWKDSDGWGWFDVLCCCTCRCEKRAAVTLTTSGTAAVDWNASQKQAREQHFPVELLQKGVVFECQEGNASMAADKSMILGLIGDGHERLDQTVHRIVAVAGLRAALEAGGTLRDEFLAAIRVGHLRKLSLSMIGSDADSEDTLRAVVAALDPAALEVLEIQSTASGSWADGLAGREWSKLRELNLTGCDELQSLPDGIWSGMGKLERLTLQYCRSLQLLPSGMEQLTSVKELVVLGCNRLQLLPSGMEQLTSLRYLKVGFGRRRKEVCCCGGLGCPKPTLSVVESLEAQGCRIEGL